MKITIIGAGAFGTSIAQQLAANPRNEITLVFRLKREVEAFNENHINAPYFPNHILDANIKGSEEWDSVSGADVVFIAVPVKDMKQVVKEMRPFLKKETLLVNLAKGIYKGGQTLVEFLVEELEHENTVALKGPSFSAEVINRQVTLLTLGFSEHNQLEIIKELIEGTGIYLDYTMDIRGVEVLSALKNIYAILLGNVDARHNAANTRYMVLTKVLLEMRLILKYLGGEEETLHLGCGIGDTALTSLTDLSRNRTLGLLIGKGFYVSDYQSNSVVLEG